MVSKPTARRRFIGDREAEIRTLPKPCLGSGIGVIAVKASGLRGGDLRHCRAAKADRGDQSTLKVAGYEPGGVTAAIGHGVAEVAIGDRVVMHHYAGCRAGAMYRIGYTQMCRRGFAVYGTGANGGYEDYLICPA